jgi:hypothetical protein
MRLSSASWKKKVWRMRLRRSANRLAGVLKAFPQLEEFSVG